MLSAAQKKKKKLLIRLVIAFCLLLIPLLAYVQRGLLSSGLDLPVGNTILVFALININGLLLLLLLYLILRNLVELAFERNQKILGSRLRTRLVISFVSLSLIPTAILFLFALGFVSTSMDYWFNAQVEESLQSSLELAQTVIDDAGKQTAHAGHQLTGLLESGLISLNNPQSLKQFFEETLNIEQSASPYSLLLLDEERNILIFHQEAGVPAFSVSAIPTEAMRQAAKTGETEVLTQHTLTGELIHAICPVHVESVDGEPPQIWSLIVSRLIPVDQVETMRLIADGITGYQQMIIFKTPIKSILIIILLLIALLVVFGAIWFGFKIARSLTDPMNRLAVATRRVAGGDLDFLLEKEGGDDEMGQLVDSFNAMTADLRASHHKLATINKALEKSKEISEQRGRYLQTILSNVAAGVITVDEHNKITTINPFAEELLAINAADFLGQDFHDVLLRQHAVLVEGFFDELLRLNAFSIERHLRVTIRRGETLSLQVNITRMPDERGRLIGFVIVFDDLTKLEKAQRLAAWQEVARRVAHEIKNPLTPIQLSAQRLRKRYLYRIGEDHEIFDQCIGTIVRQVDEIKKLVSEFSEFARMPKLHKEKKNLARLVKETVFLYREAHRHIHFTCQTDQKLPEFCFDNVQIKRMLINLLDNAVLILSESGHIDIHLEYDQQLRIARLRVEDDGPGISEELRLRIFEPYFSTRKSGTGLGLAIVQTIVNEHGGKIRANNKSPHGMFFTVELPLDT